MANISRFGSGNEFYTSVQTSNYTITTNEDVGVDSTGGTFTVTLKATPILGDVAIIRDVGQNCGTTNVAIARNGSTINGAATDENLDVNNGMYMFVYNGTTWKFTPFSGLNEAEVAAKVADGILNSVRGPGSYTSWLPSSLSPAIWFHDESNFKVVSAGGASQWEQKGSLSTAWTNAGTTAQPGLQPQLLGGRNVLRFDGSNDTLDAPAGALSLFQNIDYAWMFALYYHENTDVINTERPIFFVTVGGGGTGTRAGLFASTGSTQNIPTVGGRRLDADSFYGRASATPRSKTWVMMLGIMDYGAREISLWINGTLDGTDAGEFTAAGSTSNTVSTGARIGSNNGVTTLFIGNIAEVISGVSTGGAAELTLGDIDKIFGYAAHRWGLTSLLSGGHPYKTTPPS